MGERKRSGRWVAGQSGNPAGRKPGTGEVAKLRASIQEHVPTIIAAVVEKARQGDVQAARLLLERVLPPMKPVEQGTTLALPDGSLTEQGRAVLAAVSKGELGPGEGAKLLTGIGTLARIAELDELTARVEALERQNGIA